MGKFSNHDYVRYTCKTTGGSPSDHFPGVTKMIGLGEQAA